MKGFLRFFTILLFILLMATTFVFGEEIMPEYDLLESYIKVMAADEEYIWAAGGSNRFFMRVLYYSKDYGESWRVVHLFEKRIEGIHIGANGDLFVSVSNDRWSADAKGEIWKSTNNGREFTKVLELESGAASNWNFASDEEGYVFISEYGYKEGNNARKIYRSKDFGLTFEIVYNPEPFLGYHNHVISIEQRDNNIIYQVIGDEIKTILRSTDRGDTWSPIIDGYHPTSVLQIDETILWGLDNHPNSGIIRYDLESEVVEYSLLTPEPFGGSIYDMIYIDGILYAGLLSYDYNYWDGSIFISKDKGLTWEDYLVFSKVGDIGVGIYSLVEQGDYIFAWVTLPIENNGKIEKYQGSIRFKKISSNN